MGKGDNCSYTNSTGSLVHLICSPSDCCNPEIHTCAAHNCPSEFSLSTYLFWVILAGSALFTVLVLLISYAICRYRKPGCADAGAARDRFLEENIIAATLQRTRAHSASASTSPASTTPNTSSPPAGITPSGSPDLLVQKPVHRSHPLKSMIPVKKPSPAAVNKAFILGAEAFSRKPLAVSRAVVQAGARAVRPVQRVQEYETGISGAASPRMVQLGGFTPRANFKAKGRTESKQTIISSETDSLTTVGT